MKSIITLLFVALLSLNYGFAKDYYLLSPDKTIELKVSIDQQIFFEVFNEGKSLFVVDDLNINTLELGALGHNPKVKNVKTTTVNQVLESVVPVKSKEIKDSYSETRFEFKGKYALVFRVYDNGIAYRWETTFKKELTILDESMSMRMDTVDSVYYPVESSFLSHNERYYTHAGIADVKNDELASLPTLFEKSSGEKIILMESDLYDYPGMWIRKKDTTSVVATFPAYPTIEKSRNDRTVEVVETATYIAKTNGTRTFPWRIAGIAKDDKDLLTNDLVFQLARPIEIKDVSWIRPGKVAWDWWNALNLTGVDFESGVNTQTYKYYIDFAAENVIDYIIMDEGWYKLGDLMDIVPEIDMEEILSYAEDRQVGVILWVVWKTLDDQLEEAMNQFEQWGVKGIKVDFMQRDDQPIVNYYWKIAQEAAKRKMLVDFHGSYKPSGIRRAYPNVMTREGVRGLEQCKWTDEQTPAHNVTIPFIRMVSGPMDYTPGAMINAHKNHYMARWNRPMSMGTRSHQLAMYVIYESPLQMLADSPSNYMKEQECTSFISEIPVVWDRTLALQAKVGEHIIVARNNGRNWYVGGMCGEHGFEYSLNLDFLPAGDFKIEIIKDGINATRHAQDYVKQIFSVNNKTEISIRMVHGGGFAAIITPVL